MRFFVASVFAFGPALFLADTLPESALKKDSEKTCGQNDEDCEVELLQTNIHKRKHGRKEPHLSGIDWDLSHLKDLHDASKTPSDYMHETGACDMSKQIVQTPSMTVAEYKEISNDFKAILDAVNTECAGEVCPAADVAGCWLRMAGHDFMDWVYITGEGGSDGCITFDDPDNNGLPECLATGDNGVSIGDVYSKWCEKVSLADIIVIAGEASMEWTRDQHIAYYTGDAPEMPGAEAYKDSKPIDFSTTFKFGRKTKFNVNVVDSKAGAEKCVGRVHQMPAPFHEHCHDVERVFIGHGQLTPRETVAISAVHTLGRADERFSGFAGTWSLNMKDAMFFNNRYFVIMAADGWMVDEGMKAKGKIQWDVSSLSKPFADAKQMMLSSDLCLLYGYGTPETKGHEPPYFPLSDEHDVACAWADQHFLVKDGKDVGKYTDQTLCGEPIATLPPKAKAVQKMCCNGKKGVHDASHPSDIHGGLSPSDVLDFANDDNLLMDEFMLAWTKLTEHGTSLTPLSA